MFRRSCWLLLLTAVLSAAAAEEEKDEALQRREANRQAVAGQYKERLARYGKDKTKLVLPGLLADAQAREIRVAAEATGLKRHNTAEFFLIHEQSTHDYEAVMVCFALPSHVHRALTFLGMRPGIPVDPAGLRFWSKGERVFMTVTSASKPPAFPRRPAEQLVMDRETKRELPTLGFVFTGSRRVPAAEGDGDDYAADVRDPRAIASNYNEPDSVFDVPRQAPQGLVYETQIVHPHHVLPAGALLELVLRPEYEPGKQRVVDLVLTAAPADGTAGTNLQQVVFDVRRGTNTALRAASLNRALGYINDLVDDGRDPYVTVNLAGALPLRGARDVCALLASIEGETGIRVEPPSPGQLYFKALLPDEAMRPRARRVSQPWELHLTPGDDGLAGTLVHIEQLWKRDTIWPDLKPTEYAADSPRTLRRLLDEHGPGMAVIFVYAPGTLTHGELMTFIAPALPTHGTIHVFLD